MDTTQAIGWLTGERSMANVIPQAPLETWDARIAQADADMIKAAYYVAKAHGLLPLQAPNGKDHTHD